MPVNNRSKVKASEEQRSFPFNPYLSLKLIGDTLRTATPPSVSSQHEVIDTGILKTERPRTRAQSMVDRHSEDTELRYLRAAAEFYDQAVAELFKPGVSLGAPSRTASVMEAQQLLDAHQQLDRKLMKLPAVAPRIQLLQLVNIAIKIGVLGQRLQVREHEPVARAGRRSLEGSAKGHAAAHGTQEQKRQRWAEYQREIDRLMEKNHALSYTAAAKRTAEKFGKSTKTILRHTSHKK